MLLSSAYFSYFGAFPSEYRDEIKKGTMIPLMQSLKIEYYNKWNFIKFQATDMVIKAWKAQELPTDDFSQENGVLAMQGRRWPLSIDPQIQANRWLRDHVLGNAPPVERKNAKPRFCTALHGFRLIFKVSLLSKIAKFRKRAIGNRTRNA